MEVGTRSGNASAPGRKLFASDVVSAMSTIALFVLCVITARWLLGRLYRTAVLRQMRRRKEPIPDGVSSFPSSAETHIELSDVRDPSQEGQMRANVARRATQRQTLGRWIGVMLAVGVQVLALSTRPGNVHRSSGCRIVLVQCSNV